MIARQKQMAEIFGVLDHGNTYAYDRKISFGDVKNGKYTHVCRDDQSPPALDEAVHHPPDQSGAAARG